MQINEALILASLLMKQHGLKGWKIQVSNGKRIAGECCEHIKTIKLSRHLILMNEVREVRDVILHEIAHAIAGCSNGHNEVWKQTCQLIGAKPERCYSTLVTKMPKKTLKAVCPNCRKEYWRLRKPKKSITCYCPDCGYEKGKLVWTRVG